MDKIEALADSVESDLRKRDTVEVDSKIVGNIVMRKLKSLDKVAYIRFASVYLGFEDLDRFGEELEKLQKISQSSKQRIEVIVSRAQRKKSSTSEVVVELVADVQHKRVAFKEMGQNLYQSFYRVFEKVESAVARRKKIARPRISRLKKVVEEIEE